MKKSMLLFFFLIAVRAAAQDIHWSQPGNCLPAQNPAFAGMMNRYSASLAYRTQWKTPGAPYRTGMFGGDFRLGTTNERKAVFALGAVVFNDVAGTGDYSTTNAGLLFSSHIRASEQLKIGAGFGTAFLQHTVHLDKHAWGSQFDGISYDPSIISGEAAGTLKNTSLDLNAGISVLYEKGSSTLSSANETKLLFGYGVYHLTEQNIGIAGLSVLQMKHVLFCSGVIGLKNTRQAIEPVAFWYRQGKQNEFSFGTLYRFAFGEQSKVTGFKKGSFFSAGALFRYNDAVIPTVRFESGNFVLGISYDLNISSLTVASRSRGGMEFNLVFQNPSDFLYRKKTQPEID